MIVAHVFWLMPLHSEEAVKAAGFVSLITKISAGKQLGTPPDSYPAALAAGWETLPGDHWDADISSDFIAFLLLFFTFYSSFLLHSDLFPLPFHFFCILSLLSCPFIFPYSSPVLHFSLSFLHLCCIRFAQRCSVCRFYGIHLHCFINCFIVLSLLLVHTKQSSSGLAVWLWDCDWILEWTGLFVVPRSPRHHSNRWRFDYQVDVPIYCHLCPSARHHVSVK